MNYIESVFAIKQEILNCVMISEDEALNEETGEIIDVEALKSLQMDFDDKVYNIGMWLKNKRVEAEVLKAEKLRIEKMQKRAEADVERLTTLLTNLMDGKEFKHPDKPLVTISYRKSKKIIVDDIKAVPSEYYKVVEPEANKKLIAQALKQGIEVTGIHEEECNNIQIK